MDKLTDCVIPVAPIVFDLGLLKKKQQATWESGDYSLIGTSLQLVGETLVETANIDANESVLDIAAGNGNASLAAARCFAQVTSTDYVSHLLNKAKYRADAERLDIRFEVADAENLPFLNEQFDVVLSTFGIMFTADHDRAAQESLRVVKPGGRIALANWTPGSFVGELFQLITRYTNPPKNIASPFTWGTETRLVELYGPYSSDIRCSRKFFHFRYKSIEHWINMFSQYYGPVRSAFLMEDEIKKENLRKEIESLLMQHNISTKGSLNVPSEYLQVVITKK